VCESRFCVVRANSSRSSGRWDNDADDCLPHLSFLVFPLLFFFLFLSLSEGEKEREVEGERERGEEGGRERERGSAARPP